MSTTLNSGRANASKKYVRGATDIGYLRTSMSGEGGWKVENERGGRRDGSGRKIRGDGRRGIRGEKKHRHLP
jgi:hypothetical protein